MQLLTRVGVVGVVCAVGSQMGLSRFALAETTPVVSEKIQVSGPKSSESTGSMNSSSKNVEDSTWAKLSEKAALTYFGVYRGAALSDLGNSLQPTESGALDPGSPQSLESYLTVGYRLNKDLMLGVQGHFYYFPVGNPAGSGQSIQFWDPSLVIAKTGLVNQGGFTLTGKILTQLPLTSVDILQRQHSFLTVQPTVIANYDIPKTALSVGFYSYFTVYAPGGDAVPGWRTYKFYLAPTANYQLSKSLSATLWIDFLQVTRSQGTGVISGMKNEAIDIEPGISWDVTKNISINPVLNIYPSNPTLAATSLQAVIIAKAF